MKRKNYGTNDIFGSQIFSMDISNKKDQMFSSEFPGMTMKGSVIPSKAYLGQIKEEGDNIDENDIDVKIGNEYIDDDDEEDKKKIKKEKERKMNVSSLKMSYNGILNNNDNNDDNYVNEVNCLKVEINELINERETLQDKLTLKEQEISKKDEELKKTKLETEELKNIIEQKNNEIIQLKSNKVKNDNITDIEENK